MSLDNSFANPFRTADWRWQRACEVAEGRGQRPTRRDSRPAGYHWINQAIRFRRVMGTSANVDSNTDAHATLARTLPNLYWAYRLFMWPQVELRNSIEANILARRTDFEIGYAYGVPPQVIEAYEAVFFNVRERINHAKWIIAFAISVDIHRGAMTLPILIKLFAYFLGPHVLDAIESSFPNPIFCGTPDKVNAALQDDAIGTLKLKAALAAKMVAVNSHTQTILLDQFTKFIEVERMTDSAGQGQDQLMGHIDAMLKSLPFTIGGVIPGTSNTKLDRGPVIKFEHTSAELRLEETMALATVGELPNEEEIRNLSFPTLPRG